MLRTHCQALALAAALLAGGAALFAPADARAQELQANVTVNYAQLTILDPKVVESFETVVSEYLNNTQFTDERYEEDERIQCNFTFTITQENSDTRFTADILVQASRPVYGSDYLTTLINYNDQRAVIPYEQFQPLEFNRDNYTSTLTAFLNFYAYIIIGTDKDSFAPMTGEPFYRLAENVVTTLPAGATQLDANWGNNSRTRARYRLMQELLNPRARPYRQMLYDYHRQGLDVMAEDAVAGRAVLGQSLEKLREVRQEVPNSVLLANFAAAKTQEVIDVFLPAPQAERRAAYDVMTAIDPANVNKYRMLR